MDPQYAKLRLRNASPRASVRGLFPFLVFGIDETTIDLKQAQKATETLQLTLMLALD